MEPNHESNPYIDVHTHLLDYAQDDLKEVLNQAENSQLTHIVSNTTTSKQYEPMINMFKAFWEGKTKIIPGFGIHPCFVQFEKMKTNDQICQEIRKILQLNEVFTIGEIGLDYRKNTLQQNSKDQQLRMFLAQLNLAIEMKRPVTVHCVRAHGQMLKIFKKINSKLQTESPSIIMHSYGGSKQITKSLLKLNKLSIFFSLSLRRSTQLCEVIPIEKLLCETDSPCQNNLDILKQEGIEANPYAKKIGVQKTDTNQPSNVVINLKSLSKFYNLAQNKFQTQIYSNSLRAFRLLK